MHKNQKIAVIGLGYVGLPLAVEFGKIRPTLGFDINEHRISELESGKDSTLEVSQDTLAEANQLTFSTNQDDLRECSIFIITVPTPIDSSNRPNLKPLEAATKTVANVLMKDDIVIYESTVYPGCTEEICVPILEDLSGLTFNQDFFCGYSPERINPGDKVNTLTEVVKITSGSTPEISDQIDLLYRSIIKAGTFKASTIKVAEAAKVIENSQRDLNIAFVNELSVIFSRLGVDTVEVLEAAGSKWNFIPMRPGIVGGHCIGVDPYYLTHKAEQVGYNPQVILAGRRINDNMAPYIAKTIIKRMLQCGIKVSDSSIGILGITFKENCPDIRNTKVLDLISELKQWNVSVKVCDCWADTIEVKETYGIDFDLIDENNKVDSLIVAVGHNEYRNYSAKMLKSFCKGDNPVIGDIKAIYDKNSLEDEGFSVFRL